MVSADVAALRRLATKAKEQAAAATPGPWIQRAIGHWDDKRHIDDVDGGLVAAAFCDPEDAKMQVIADAAFIAAARTDVPALADAVLALADENERLRMLAICRDNPREEDAEEIARLAAQVQRVKALCDDHARRHPDPSGQPCDYHCPQQIIIEVRAALAEQSQP